MSRMWTVLRAKCPTDRPRDARMTRREAVRTINAYERGGLYAITRPGDCVDARVSVRRAAYRLQLARRLLKSRAVCIEYTKGPKGR